MTDDRESDEVVRPILIIGHGNPLRRDDGVGPLVVQTVEEWRVPGVSCLSAHQLLPEFAEPLAHSRLAVFVDARRGGENSSICTTSVEPGQISSPIDHAISPSNLLTLARDLFGRSPSAWLIGIAASDFSLGEGLSESAAEGRADALRQIATILKSCLSESIRIPIDRIEPNPVFSPGYSDRHKVIQTTEGTARDDS